MSAEAPDRCSVIVVLHNSEEHLAECLRSVPAAAEVILVDNGSTDDGLAVGLRERPQAVVVRPLGNVGFGAGCNAGAAHASRDVLLFLNPDAQLLPGCIERLVEHLDMSPRDVVAPLLLDAEGAVRHNCRRATRLAHDAIDLVPRLGRLAPKALHRDVPASSAIYRDGGPVDYVQGACFALRAATFDAVGRFDESYFLYGEEELLAERVRCVGGLAYYQPEAQARHYAETSTSKVRLLALGHLWRSRWRGHVRRLGRGRVAVWWLAILLLLLLRVVIRAVRSGQFDLVEERVIGKATLVALLRPRPRGYAGSLDGPPLQPSGGAARVALYCDWFVRYSVDQAIGLRAEGAAVMLVCIARADEFGGDRSTREAWLDRARAAGVVVRELPRSRRSVASWLDAWHARSEIGAFSPDLVHAHTNFDPRLFALSVGRPTVVTVHDGKPHPGAPGLGRAAQRVQDAWVRTADVVVVHGRRIADDLPDSVDRRRVVTVPHGTRIGPRPLPAPATPSVLFFGRLEAYKGIPVLLQAFELLHAREPDVRLIVAGDGPLRDLVKQQDGIDARVGHVPETEIVRLFEQATVVALPYVEASQSGVAAQAIGLGVPVVVSDVGELPATVCSERFIVPPGDVDRLAETLAMVLRADERTREAVLDHARRNFSWRHAARVTLAAYRERGLI